MKKIARKERLPPSTSAATEHRLLWNISRKATNTAVLLTLATGAIEGTLQMRKDRPAKEYPAFAFLLCEKILNAPAGNNNIDYENDAANFMLSLILANRLPPNFVRKNEEAIRTANRQLYCSENFGAIVQ